MRPIAILIAGLLVVTTWSQEANMTLSNGSMTIQPGTTLVLQGPITWTIAPGAGVENNGSIELGTESRLVEVDGAPVTGAGTEHCELPLTNGATDLEPGGLGLTLSIPATAGSLVLTRGHLPRSAGGQIESIARWYALEAASLESVPYSLSFRYDVTELNGLAPDVLSLHSSPSLGGPWADMPTDNDVAGSTLTSGLVGAGIYITAFDPDQTTAISRITPVGPFRVWPTAASDVVHVQELMPMGPVRIEVLDASGKIVSAVQNASFAGGPLNVDVSALPTGCYLLRINTAHVQRFVKT